MLRALVFSCTACVVTMSASGCFCAPADESGCDLDLDLTLASLRAKIRGLQARYAVGTRAKVWVDGDAPVRLESSDPDIVRVERTTAGEAILTFVGEGKAALTVRNELGEEVYEVEVAPHATFLVLLAEITFVPLGSLSGQVVLCGPQYVLVLYLDADGRRLFGDGLAEVRFSAGLERCDRAPGSVDGHCLSSNAAGAHTVMVRVGNEERTVEYETVPADEIVGVEVLQADERELAPGTWSQIDVIGWTEDGRRVSSLHPQLYAPDGWYLGYLAYQYDPVAAPTSVRIRVLEEDLRTELRGVPSSSRER